MQKISFKPREYQKRILDITSDSIEKTKCTHRVRLWFG